MVSLLSNRVSPKIFNNRDIDKNELLKLVECCNLSPTSFGIQPVRLTNVSEFETKAELLSATYNQSQVMSCSNIFVFSIFDIKDNNYIDYYKYLIKDITNVSQESVDRFENSLQKFLENKSFSDYVLWASNQAYLTLGILIASCASMGIDCCPIEGFNKEKYSEILGLNKNNLQPIIICALGYASSEDPRSMLPKVRVPLSTYVV